MVESDTGPLLPSLLCFAGPSGLAAPQHRSV